MHHTHDEKIHWLKPKGMFFGVIKGFKYVMRLFYELDRWKCCPVEYSG